MGCCCRVLPSRPRRSRPIDSAHADPGYRSVRQYRVMPRRVPSTLALGQTVGAMRMTADLNVMLRGWCDLHTVRWRALHCALVQASNPSVRYCALGGLAIAAMRPPGVVCGDLGGIGLHDRTACRSALRTGPPTTGLALPPTCIDRAAMRMPRFRLPEPPFFLDIRAVLLGAIRVAMSR